jgi:hypothetical protein
MARGHAPVCFPPFRGITSLTNSKDQFMHIGIGTLVLIIILLIILT